MKSNRAFGLLGGVVFGLGLTLALPACDNGAEKVEQEKRAAEEQAAKVKAKAEEEAEVQRAVAARELRIADEKAAPARLEARTALQKSIAQIDGKVMGLKEKLSKGKAKPAALAASAAYDTVRTTTERDMQELNVARGAAWDAQKAKLDADVKSLGEAGTALEKAMR